MNKETKYRLKKDLPDGSKEGDTYKHKVGTDLVYINETREQRMKIPYFAVENNPDWFEPIEDEIRVVGIGKYQKSETFDSMFSTNKEFSNEKYPLIKQAIENIINDKIS